MFLFPLVHGGHNKTFVRMLFCVRECNIQIWNVKHWHLYHQLYPVADTLCQLLVDAAEHISEIQTLH
jgi:hypothetical protein